MGSCRFVRTCDFTFRKRRTLVVFGDDSLFFDFSTFRERRKRDKVWMILCKVKQGAISEIRLQKR
jgi:hypothetical protein